MVVVLPSPSGVGVMAVTSMYLPLGRSLSFPRPEHFGLVLAIVVEVVFRQARASATSLIGSICRLRDFDVAGDGMFDGKIMPINLLVLCDWTADRLEKR